MTEHSFTVYFLGATLSDEAKTKFFGPNEETTDIRMCSQNFSPILKKEEEKRIPRLLTFLPIMSDTKEERKKEESLQER